MKIGIRELRKLKLGENWVEEWNLNIFRNSTQLCKLRTRTSLKVETFKNIFLVRCTVVGFSVNRLFIFWFNYELFYFILQVKNHRFLSKSVIFCSIMNYFILSCKSRIVGFSVNRLYFGSIMNYILSFMNYYSLQ